MTRKARPPGQARSRPRGTGRTVGAIARARTDAAMSLCAYAQSHADRHARLRPSDEPINAVKQNHVPGAAHNDAPGAHARGRAHDVRGTARRPQPRAVMLLLAVHDPLSTSLSLSPCGSLARPFSLCYPHISPRAERPRPEQQPSPAAPRSAIVSSSPPFICPRQAGARASSSQGRSARPPPTSITCALRPRSISAWHARQAAI